MKRYILPILALFVLASAIGTSARADDQQGKPRSLAALFDFKTDSEAGTPLDRLVGALAAEQKAKTAYAEAASAKLAAEKALEPVSQELQSRQDELSFIPAQPTANLKIAGARESLRGALTEGIADLRKQVQPLLTAFCQKVEAAAAAKKTLDEAEKETSAATTAWQDAMMKPALENVVALATRLTTVTAERDESLAQGAKDSAELTALRAKVAEFCGRNPSMSLCSKTGASGIGS